MVNGTLLNFGKRYKDKLRAFFDHWPKLQLGLDALSNQKTLKGIYFAVLHYVQKFLISYCGLYLPISGQHK